MTADTLYTTDLLEEYREPQNKTILPDADVVQAQFNASCGDDVTVYVKLNGDKTHIEKVTWQGSGCVISQVTLSKLSAFVVGKEVSAVLQLKQADLLNLLGMSEISYGREKCLQLGLVALQRAVEK